MTLAERPFDLTRIAEVLERHGVLYVTIGGACGLLHGATEYLTKDVDVMARSEEGNRRRLAAALTELGARADGAVTADDLIGNTQWETGAGPIDVVITATGPDETVFMYADIQPRSVVYTLGGEGMRGGYSIVLPADSKAEDGTPQYGAFVLTNAWPDRVQRGGSGSGRAHGPGAGQLPASATSTIAHTHTMREQGRSCGFHLIVGDPVQFVERAISELLAERTA